MIWTDIDRLLFERLERQAAGVAHVLSAAELADMTRDAIPLPSIHLVFEGLTPVDQPTPRSSIQAMLLTWTTVVAVRYRHDRAQDAHRDAEPLLTLVLESLLGYRPQGDVAPLQLGRSGRPRYEESVAMYPLTWTTRRTLRGAAD